MISGWLARIWQFLKSAPLVLLAVMTALLAIQARRRAGEKAWREFRVSDPRLDGTNLTPQQQAKEIERQLDAMARAKTHVQAATRARRLADIAASRIETAGQPSLAETLRSWNRE